MRPLCPVPPNPPAGGGGGGRPGPGARKGFPEVHNATSIVSGCFSTGISDAPRVRAVVPTPPNGAAAGAGVGAGRMACSHVLRTLDPSWNCPKPPWCPSGTVPVALLQGGTDGRTGAPAVADGVGEEGSGSGQLVHLSNKEEYRWCGERAGPPDGKGRQLDRESMKKQIQRLHTEARDRQLALSKSLRDRYCRPKVPPARKLTAEQHSRLYERSKQRELRQADKRRKEFSKHTRVQPSHKIGPAEFASQYERAVQRRAQIEEEREEKLEPVVKVQKPKEEVAALVDYLYQGASFKERPKAA